MSARLNPWLVPINPWSGSPRPFIPPRRGWVRHARRLVDQINLRLNCDQPMAEAYHQLNQLMKKYGRDSVLRAAGLPLADHIRWSTYAALENQQPK